LNNGAATASHIPRAWQSDERPAPKSIHEAWTAIGTKLPRPKAILSISAHWYIEDAAVTVSTAPRTIHDFAGFPRELYQVPYPAPGAPDLAARVQKLLAPLPVRLDESWGLDHGTWSVLCHVYPKADIPVVQLSIDETQPSSFHYEIGKRPSGTRAFSSSAAGTSSTTCTHTHGDGTRKSRTTGRLCSSSEYVSCCSPARAPPWLLMRINSVVRRSWPSRRQTITCRCCTLSAPGHSLNLLPSPLKG